MASDSEEVVQQPPRAAPPATTELFKEVAIKSGIDFVHVNGMSGEMYFPEPVGAGVALFDYDNDGDLDVYLVQGARFDTKDTAAQQSGLKLGTQPVLRDRLYRNDGLVDLAGEPTLQFSDVTTASGIDSRGYGMGVAAGDYDNDGWTDLYVTNFGENLLLKNNGDGTFSDTTAQAGAADSRWSTSAAFLDYDRDGNLDLYIANYVTFNLNNHKPCYSRNGARDYCGPKSYKPEPDRLLHNRGNGTFEDVTALSQIARAYGAGLGVVGADFNNDGWTDFYVANDGMANQLWMNLGNGRFEEQALLAGAAFNQDGMPEASMGVDAGDIDADGDDDLFMTHLVEETNTLYLNDGQGFFEDASMRTGLGTASRSYTGFGTAFFDYDNDGWLDVLSANGAVKTIEALARVGDPYPLHEKNQLFRNLGKGRFEEISTVAGEVFQLSEVSRGAAFGDLDNDGDTDVLITNNNGRARLLLNQTGNKQHWLGLKLVTGEPQRDALGARVAVERSSGHGLWRNARSDGSYCSANDPRVLIGLGNDAEVSAVTIHWPSGREERFSGVEVDHYTTVHEGTGEIPAP